MNLKPNERSFNVKPLGIKYICEHCNEGEMIARTVDQIDVENLNLIKHECSKCGKSLSLPKVYPYIEWIKEDEENETA